MAQFKRQGGLWNELVAKLKNGETFRNSLISLILKVSGVALLFGLTLFLTNNFKAEFVGQYGFARSVLLILGGISIIGAEQSIIYYSGYLRSQNAFNNIQLIYRKTLKLIFFSTLGLILIVLLINADFINSFFQIENPYGLIKKVVLYIFFHSVMMLNIETFRGMNKIVVSEFYRNIMRYLVFFIMAYLLMIGDLGTWLVDAYLLSFVLLAILTTLQVYFYFRKLGEINPTVEISSKEIFMTSYPMALNAMTFFLMQSTNVILLGKFKDFETVAYFDTAARVASLTAMGVMAVNVVVAPKLAEEFSRNNKVGLKKIYRSAIRLMVILSTPAVLFLLFFGEFTMGLFGQEYKTAKTALLILVVAQFLVTFLGISGTYMNMTGKQRVLHKILLVAFFVNVALNFLLIPIYGMNGAAMATGISIVGWNLFTQIYIYKKDGVSAF
ncbi:MAG: polysaccharide biosynthesis C-terminal domain-containing protein [Weeksellaceae bacterium]